MCTADRDAHVRPAEPLLNALGGRGPFSIRIVTFSTGHYLRYPHALFRTFDLLPRVNSFTTRKLNLLLCGCLLAVIACTAYVILFKYQASLNSDGAEPAVLARLAFNSGSAIPYDWRYANGDLWLLGPRLFSIIAYPLVGIGYRLTAISDLCAYVYLLLVVFGTCRMLSPGTLSTPIIATALAAGGLSTLNFEFVIGQGAYSLYAGLALSLFVLAVVNNGLKLFEIRRATLALSAIAACLVCVSNATRGLVTIVVPLVVGWLAASVLQPKSKLKEAILKLVSPIIYFSIVGAAIGTLIYKFGLIPHFVNFSEAAGLGFASASTMWQHAKQLPDAWLVYFNVNGPWQSLDVPLQVLQVLVWMTSILLIAAPAYVAVAAKHRGSKLAMFAWIALASYAIPIAALVGLPHLYVDPTSLRYLTFGIYAGLCLTTTLLSTLVRRWPLALAALGVTLCGVSFATIAVWRQEGQPTTFRERMALINALEQQGVGTALATYWNSHVLTVLSNGRLDVYPITTNSPVGVRPFPYNSPTSIVNGTAGKYQAVALMRTEATPGTWSKIANVLGPPAKRLVSGPFDVWIYHRRIAGLVYAVGMEVNHPVSSNQLGIILSNVEFSVCRTAGGCRTSIRATNSGSHTLSSIGTKPLRLGVMGVDANGEVVDQNTGRVDFPVPLVHGASERIDVVLPAVSNPNIAGYRLCLLQEFVAWRCDLTKSSADATHAPIASTTPLLHHRL